MFERDHIEYYSSGKPPARQYSGVLGRIQSLGMLLFLPLCLVYLELVFHWYMGLEMKYAPIIILFSYSFGLILSVFTIVFPPKINRVMAYVITCICCLIFCIEMICKTVLKQYYQLFSSADTAANNNLMDYFDAISNGIMSNLVGIILMLLPIVALILLSWKLYRFRQKGLGVCVILLIVAAIVHILALGVMRLPWSGDFAPKSVYAMDTNVEDQVEQFGIITMLRLDCKHTLWGVKKELGEEIEGFSTPVPEVQDEEEDHVMEFDFESLMEETQNEQVQWLHQYVQSLTPTSKNEYTGIFEGYNVIFITLEGFSGYLVDEARTPTLYRLMKEGMVFNNYYTPLHYTSTSGGEFQNMVGLYPKSGNPISMKETGKQKTNLYFSLANQLNRLGYTSIGFHNNKEMYGRSESHTNLGYDWKQGGNGFTMEVDENGKEVWPQSDQYMFEQTVDQFITMDRFNVYYLTVSGHMPYNFSGNAMGVKHKSAVENLPYTEETKAYLAANMEVEEALRYLIERLEEADKINNTLIVMTPDHIPYFNVDTVEELAGKIFGGSQIENLKESDVDFDLYKNMLVMWSGSMEEPIQVDKICGQVDILPTVSNLLGLEYDSRLLVGSDIFSQDTPLVVFFSSCWLTDQGLYNRYTGEFTLAQGVSMTEEEKADYVKEMKKLVSYKLQASVSIIEEDYYEILLGE